MAFQAGDPLHKLSAKWLNRVDALVRKTDASGDSLAIGELESQWADNTIIRVRNESGAAVRQWGVLGIGDPIITPAQNVTEFFGLAMRGMSPRHHHRGKFCVLIEPLAPGAIGRAVMVGVVPVRLHEPAEGSSGSFADIQHADTHTLKRGNKGVPIVWYGDPEPNDNGTGQIRWAIINLTPGAGGASQQDPTCCGCSPTECFDFQFWEIQGGCPRYFALTVDDDIGCCNGDAGGTHILEYQAASGYEPAMWKGPTFQCGTRGDDCGTASWVWTAGSDCGTATFEWQSLCDGCLWRWTPMQISGGSVFPGYWIMENNNCSECGGCSAPSNNPLVVQYEYGLDPSQPQTMMFPCNNGSGQWVLISACTCGSATAPTEPGTTNGEIVTVLCTGGGAAQWTLETNSCDCGDPVPPEQPGTIEGEILTTACVDPNAAPECGTSTWERKLCEYVAVSAACDLADLDTLGGILVDATECAILQPTSEETDCRVQSPIAAGNIVGYKTTEGTWIGLEPGDAWTVSDWLLISNDCTCGMAIPPRQDLYAPDGTQIVRPCESPILAHWQLIPPSGYDPAEIQLVIAGTVRIRYRLPYLRTYCCKCQMRFDIVVDDTCSFPCRGIPQSVCVRPLRTGPPGGSCRDYSPLYSLYVEGFEEFPILSGGSPESARQEWADMLLYPIRDLGHPREANGNFLLALNRRACCGNSIDDPTQTDICPSLACEWFSEPVPIGEVCTGNGGTAWCVDGERLSGSGSCVPEHDGNAVTRICETQWAGNLAGRWHLRNYTVTSLVPTVCGGLKLYLHNGWTTAGLLSTYVYDWEDQLDDGSLVFKYNGDSINPDKFPQFVMLVPVNSL